MKFEHNFWYKVLSIINKLYSALWIIFLLLSICYIGVFAKDNEKIDELILAILFFIAGISSFYRMSLLSNDIMVVKSNLSFLENKIKKKEELELISLAKEQLDEINSNL